MGKSGGRGRGGTVLTDSLAQYLLLGRYILHVRPLGRRRRPRDRHHAAAVIGHLSLFHVAHGRRRRVEYQHLAGPDDVGRHVGRPEKLIGERTGSNDLYFTRLVAIVGSRRRR